MNSLFGRLNKALKLEFKKTFQSGSISDVFGFLNEYMRFVEDDNDSYRHLFSVGEDPLAAQEENQDAMKEFNKKCLEFLSKTISSSEKSHPYDSTLSEAQTYMGLGYEFGLFGLRKDGRMAIGYYSSAARQNHPVGTFRMGQCLEKGIGKPRNHRHALDFYRCSAKLGFVVGMHAYGSILINGDIGSKKDLQSGLFYLKLAARKASKEYPYPYYDLAQTYESSTAPSEIQPDDEYAFRMYLRGAELDCPNCQYRVARCYELGELMQDKNLPVAVEWYRRASLLGQIDAQMIYSRILFTGVEEAVQPNLKESFFWALKAAVRGHSQAAFSVAEFIETGCGTSKNTFLALWWYTISYESGNTQAKSRLMILQNQIDMRNEGTKEPRCCGCF
ncbi:putative SKT5-like protein [Encephalitozoon cuniculi GB-M1]|uniref:SKT5-like protein n=1 Tax=Encephalitozoon cuniculi (strain GB-M1) TaxID=284813 RepID=Q8SVD0_ENCCU|nr:uncharacterized protein ECU06_0540 [Encephalitozoon cuniculi GB-M1]CAD25414.1 putative SKT5-like protein [Encephalitozoon cuniculi GB-M1]